MRTLTAWLLALALALGCAPGLAQSREETCATVFETEAPSLLLPALEALGYAPGDVRCGALWEYTPCVYALIALERDGVRTLAGAVLDLDGVWRTENLGEKMLLPGRDFRIVFRNPVGARPAIYVEYAPLNGVTERYGFSYEYWLYGEVLWRVDSYQREEADGDGYAITRYPYEGFCMRSLAEPDSPTNQQFALISDAQLASLSEACIVEFEGKEADSRNMVRFCTSWSTTDAEVDAVVAAIEGLPE